MSRHHTTIGLSVFAVLQLNACGKTDQVSIDTSSPDRCSYIECYQPVFTEIDRTQVTTLVPSNGVNNSSAGSSNKASLIEGNGIEDDGKGNRAFHIRGKVARPISNYPQIDSHDIYWDSIYGDLCVDNNCQNVITPFAHLCYQPKIDGSILGQYANGLRGFVFSVKVGSSHDGLTQGTPRPIRITAPMDLTDIPDPLMSDAFGTLYSGCDDPKLSDISDKNSPFCLFPGSRSLTGTDAVGVDGRTCGCHFQTREINVSSAWQTYCVQWTAFEAPECPGLAKATSVTGGIVKLLPDRLTKIQFEAYRPQGDESEANYDIWIGTDFKLLHDDKSDSNAKWEDYCGTETGAIVL
jgi:hypothetical protein